MSSLLNDLSNNAVNYVLTQQDKIQQIISQESDRLDTKSNSIDQATQSQQRLISLNQNYSSRYNQYILMVVVIIVALVLFLGITLIQRNMENPPAGFFTFLTVLIFGGAFVYVIIIYNTIMSRSNMDYDQLNIQTPMPLTGAALTAQQTANTESGNLLGGVMAGDCIGASCCATGTTWDPTSQSCRALCPIGTKTWDATDKECQSSATCTSGNTCVTDPFSTLSMYPLIPAQSGSIQPYTVSEYDEYARV